MADAAPALSIVVPTRDTRALTLRCLAAAASDLPAGAELVVVDDGSADGTGGAVAAAHPAARVVRLDPPRGFTAAANAGLAAARGRLLWLLNSDTEVVPGAAAALADAFARAPRLGAAGPLLVSPDGSPQWSAGRWPDPRWLFALASGVAALAGRLPEYRRRRPVAGHDGRAVDWIPATALVLRAEAWRAVGPLDERFALYAQDADLCRRLHAARWSVALVPAARVLHVGGATVAAMPGATGGGQDPARLWTELVRLVAKHDGAAAAGRARAALRAGAALRLAARRAATPLVPAARRAAWRRDTAAYARAAAALAADG